MKTHVSNAAYGILDYAAYPIGMLLVAPVVLRHLGPVEYGIWTAATAAVSVGGIIASGFGDANIQNVARLRAPEKREAREQMVRTSMGIHIVLGVVAMIAGWMLSPVLARHIVTSNTAQRTTCLHALRLASILMLIRAIESVCISTQRAFERYGAAVRISLAVRWMTLLAAAGLAFFEQNTSAIMLATTLLFILGTWLQLARLRKLIAATSLWPTFDAKAARLLFAFGIFSWLQAVSGVIFGQADRLLLGVSMGAVALTSYALCVQLAQPVYGLAASGLHFLFPYLSGRLPAIAPSALRRALLTAFASNLIYIVTAVALLLLFGGRLLQVWAGPAIAQSATPLLPTIVCGSALLGLNVTGTYALLALGQSRTVAWVGIMSGAAMLVAIRWLLPHYGAEGLGIARLIYGASSLLIYLPLLRCLRAKRNQVTSALASTCDFPEAART